MKRSRQNDGLLDEFVATKMITRIEKIRIYIIPSREIHVLLSCKIIVGNIVIMLLYGAKTISVFDETLFGIFMYNKTLGPSTEKESEHHASSAQQIYLFVFVSYNFHKGGRGWKSFWVRSVMKTPDNKNKSSESLTDQVNCALPANRMVLYRSIKNIVKYYKI